jgi:hypothetical protein
MYNLSNLAGQLKYEDIDGNWANQYFMYKTYIGNFKLNRAIKSPFRSDKNPSFSIYSSKLHPNLYWRDFATGEHGSWQSFLRRITGQSKTSKALDVYLTTGGVKVPKIEEKGPLYVSETKIQVVRRAFNQKDLEYWGSYGLNEEQLKKYNVAPIKCYFVNEEQWVVDDLAYCFKVFNHFKIYRPFADKKLKWRTDTTQYDIFGFEQLAEKGQTLIITKALKDVMVLDMLGFNAIAPQSENSIIPENVIRLLKSKFKKLVVFFDNDEGGKRGRDTLVDKYKLDSIMLPTDNPKDISDLVKAQGIAVAKQTINELLTNDKAGTSTEDTSGDTLPTKD